MSLIEFLIYLLIGGLAGFLGGLLGVGGGLVVVPSLVWTFHFLGFSPVHTMQIAVGTSLGSMIFTAFSSALSHVLKKGVYWNFALSLIPGIIVGGILGALIADYLPSKQLGYVFGFSVGIVGIYFLTPAPRDEAKVHSKPVNPFVMFFWGIIIGSISTILGIGGGVMTVPLLTFFWAPIRNAISTSAVTGFVIALVGGLSFLYLGLSKATFSDSVGYLYLPALFSVGITAALFAPLGAKCAYIWPTTTLRRIFGILLIVVGVLMIFHF